MLKKLIYLLLFCFCTWLALATRRHSEWFHPFVVEYAGDTIWAGMFVFFLRIFFPKTNVWKLALFTYIAGVIVELQQLIQWDWLVAIRHTYLGKLLLGLGFVPTDLICYAVGVVLACPIVILIDKAFEKKQTVTIH
jgi:hypothetical protein